MPTDLTLRPATTADLPAIAELLRAGPRGRRTRRCHRRSTRSTRCTRRRRLGPARRRRLGGRGRLGCRSVTPVDDAWLDSLYVAARAAGAGHRQRAARRGQGAARPTASACGSSRATNPPAPSTPSAGSWSSSAPTAPPTRRGRRTSGMAWPGTDPLALLPRPDRRRRRPARRAAHAPRRAHRRRPGHQARHDPRRRPRARDRARRWRSRRPPWG